MTIKKNVYLHHAPIRVWHWVNAVGFFFLTLTGIQIRFAEYLTFGSLEQSIFIHNYIGFMVLPNYLLWLFYYFVSRQMHLYFPAHNKILVKIKKQIVYYGFGVFRKDPNPHKITPRNKFNVLQQITYALVMFILLPVQMISGVMLWQIKSFENYIYLLGGIKVVSTIHVLLFFFFTAFLIIHVYMSTFGKTPTAHFKSMFTGYEEA